MLLLPLLVACGGDASFVGRTKVPDAPDGDAVLQLEPAEVFIEEIDPLYAKSGTLTLTSTGTADLLVYEARMVENPDGVFYFETVETNDDMAIPAGATVTWYVTATLSGPVAADGTLRIRTNDPAATNVLVPVHARPVGWVDPGDTGGADTGDTGSEG
jgi:hypothetical protein